MKIGQQLMTRDGRVFSNAIVVKDEGTPEELHGEHVYLIEEENGLLHKMTKAEIRQHFWVADKQNFERIADYREWVTRRRSRILANRKLLKFFQKPGKSSRDNQVAGRARPDGGTDPKGPSSANEAPEATPRMLEEETEPSGGTQAEPVVTDQDN